MKGILFDKDFIWNDSCFSWQLKPKPNKEELRKQGIEVITTKSGDNYYMRVNQDYFYEPTKNYGEGIVIKIRSKDKGRDLRKKIKNSMKYKLLKLYEK